MIFKRCLNTLKLPWLRDAVRRRRHTDIGICFMRRTRLVRTTTETMVLLLLHRMTLLLFAEHWPNSIRPTWNMVEIGLISKRFPPLSAYIDLESMCLFNLVLLWFELDVCMSVEIKLRCCYRCVTANGINSFVQWSDTDFVSLTLKSVEKRARERMEIIRHHITPSLASLRNLMMSDL